MKTYDLIREILVSDPHMDNDKVAMRVQQRLPGSTTSAASVSSTKSRLRKNGDLSAEPTTLPLKFVEQRILEDKDEELPVETKEERSIRIRNRYETLERMANRVAAGHLPSLIVSGPPGLGKSYTVEQVLAKSGKSHDIMSGTISAVGLYIALYEQRKGGIVVLDDCDDVFRDETCLNILKAVLDSSETRTVSYRKKAHWMVEEDIPSKFEFNGSVVFCTNIDFEVAIAKGSSISPHFEALIDRSLYLSLTMRSQDDFLTRLYHVGIEDKQLESRGLTEEQATEVMDYVVKNANRFYGLSIRLLMQIAFCYTDDVAHWQHDIEATKMRTF
jgi:hypothetical protein